MNNSVKFNTRALTGVAITVALISISAWINIPLVIPITLQSFGVFFALFFLGGRLGSLAVLVYLALGSVGAPVFAGFSGGISHFLDASGGFLFGLLLASLLFWLLEYLLPKRPLFSIISSGASLAVLYLSGALWYRFVYLGGGNFGAVLLTAVLPFILPDVLKILLAYFISERLSSVANINIQRKK